jgi:hypothetical protein
VLLLHPMSSRSSTAHSLMSPLLFRHPSPAMLAACPAEGHRCFLRVAARRGHAPDRGRPPDLPSMRSIPAAGVLVEATLESTPCVGAWICCCSVWTNGPC